MQIDFNSWSEYHDWLKVNCETFAIFSVKDENGKIIVDYCTVEEWNQKYSG